MKTALVNTNRMKPPVAPIGLEYVAEAMRSFGHGPDILDLNFEKRPESTVARFFENESYDLVGLTLRNTDDCAYTSRRSFTAGFLSLVSDIRSRTDAVILLGGVGFSVMPELILENSEADAGVWGEGEFMFPEIAARIEKKEEWKTLPNLVVCQDGGWQKKHVKAGLPGRLPLFRRDIFDNRRYFREGGQAGFETKRGCNRSCIYCADPVAKGKRISTRPPGSVVHELSSLLDQGIDVFHTCDSEFNIPIGHAIRVCEAMVEKGLGKKIRWYAYCAPVPFTTELAKLMRRSGCIGINFGVDSGDKDMLKRLGRDFGPQEVTDAVKICRDEKITVMADLLIGGPGESRESIMRSIDLVRGAGPHRIGINAGVRVYPGTPLSEMVKQFSDGLVGDKDPWGPLFYCEPDIARDISSIVQRATENDERFLFFDPSVPSKNYNYNDNTRLVRAIEEGHRGAYWDILRNYKA
jgi:hypothetical protein